MTLDDFPPMLLVERPIDLDDPGWFFEPKFDGYRVTAMFGEGKCKLRTRNGADASRWFPEVCRSLAAVEGGPYVTDGEVCVLDELGRSDFGKLQDRARRRRWNEGADPAVYCVFDLLAEGDDVMLGDPLYERKARLREVLGTGSLPAVLVVGHFVDAGRQLFDPAVHQPKVEGLVAKRADSPYRPGIRSADWVKVKRNGAILAERFKRED